MKAAALSMSHAEKQQRKADKRLGLLGFLASGEVYTTLAAAAELLQTSERNALRLMQSLESEKLIKVDMLARPGRCSSSARATLANAANLVEKLKVDVLASDTKAVRLLESLVAEHLLKANADVPNKTKLYGITAHALAITESAHPACREFFVSQTNPDYVPHHIEGQLIRITAERAGWKDWVPGKLLYVKNIDRLKKLPDALVSRPDGRAVAVEIERHIKSKKRLAEVVAAHLSQILDKHYQMVYYFTPHKVALDRAFAAVLFVIVNGDKVKLTDAQRARFKVFDMRSWAGEV